MAWSAHGQIDGAQICEGVRQALAKTDASDAEAICEAGSPSLLEAQPSRSPAFSKPSLLEARHVEAVAAKSVDQQCLSMLHNNETNYRFVRRVAAAQTALG